MPPMPPIFDIDDYEEFSQRDGFYLTVIEGEDFGRVFKLNRSTLILGNSDVANIQISDPKIAAQQLNFEMFKFLKANQAQILVTNLNYDTDNVLLINNQPVYQQVLHNGDRLKVGDTIFRFQIYDPIEVANLDKLYQQATRDPLTGLSNRNYFQNELRKFISIAEKYQRKFSILMVDLDFFRQINDSYGHDVGNQVLKAVAKILMQQTRNHDVAARIGGEEFVMLLPETDLTAAAKLAQHISQQIKAHDFKSINCLHQVTISIGIAEYPTSAETGEDILRRADEALYQAKINGRDKIYFANATEFIELLAPDDLIN